MKPSTEQPMQTSSFCGSSPLRLWVPFKQSTNSLLLHKTSCKDRFVPKPAAAQEQPTWH